MSLRRTSALASFLFAEAARNNSSSFEAIALAYFRLLPPAPELRDVLSSFNLVSRGFDFANTLRRREGRGCTRAVSILMEMRAATDIQIESLQ
jgi:hypothetical protein